MPHFMTGDIYVYTAFKLGTILQIWQIKNSSVYRNNHRFCGKNDVYFVYLSQMFPHLFSGSQ